MIFSVRQLVEKCNERSLSLGQVFVDFTKAFDTVNRNALWKVAAKVAALLPSSTKYGNYTVP